MLDTLKLLCILEKFEIKLSPFSCRKPVNSLCASFCEELKTFRKKL